MNWDALGASAEMLGVVGVIASLVYLGRQMHESSKATQAATVDQITGRFIDWMQFYATSPLHRKFFFEGLDGLKAASEDDVMDFYASIQTLYKIIEEIRYQRSQGLIDDEVWLGWNNWFANMKSYDVVQYFFDMKKSNMSPDFQEYWENLTPKPDSSLVGIVRSLSNSNN